MASILLTGDVMIGRGIDQILPNRSDPILFEQYMTSARGYVALAEARNGPIPDRVPFDYVWGESLPDLRRADLRIINLETALTRGRKPAPKGIHYRCHPANAPCLTAAAIDCCVLANNHVLDWGEEGLLETLATLEAAGLSYAGAGRDRDQAEAPAVLTSAEGTCVFVYAMAFPSSGVPPSWAAASGRPGVNLQVNYREALERTAVRIKADKEPGDIAIVSIHWGPNWGYEIPDADQRFARLLVSLGGADMVHGHSSHHAMAAEVHRGKPILYGCGDFLNDYEGISGHEEYRPELVLAYRISFDADGKAGGLDMHPFRIRRFRLDRANERQAEWLRATMDRECRRFGGRVSLDYASVDGGFVLRLSQVAASR